MNHRIGIVLMAITGLVATSHGAPVISDADRTVQFPQPSIAIPFSASIKDADATINNVTLYVDTNYPSAPGTTAYTPHTMSPDSGTTWSVNIPGVTDKTFVKWYIEATNSNSETTRYPAGSGFGVFEVNSDPIDINDLVITELIADPNGSDAVTNSEWFEVYNRSSQELDLSYFLYGNYPTGPNARVVSEGTKIPANSYMVFAGSKALFMTTYPYVDPNAVYNIGWTAAVLPNSGGETNNVFFAHANERNWNGSTIPFAHVPYINGVGDWPSWATTNSNTTSFQLGSPSLDIANGLNWNMSPLATPGFPNRVITVAMPVVGNPAPNTPVAFEAIADNWATSLKLYYRLEGQSTYSTVDFAAPASGTTWTATIPTGFADKSVVEWYVEATAPEGIVHYPFNATASPLSFWVTSVAPVPDTVVINEIVYDPQGGDNGTYSEWTELYNPGTTTIDLSGVIFGRNLTLGDSAERVMPSGTIIQPGGYLVLVGNASSFGSVFSSVPSNIVVDLAWGTASVYNNTNGVANLRYPGGNLRGQIVYLDQVPYTSSDPWPAGANNNGGATIELINPVLDNSNPYNWRTSIGDIFAGANRGTPGYQNSTFTTDINISIQGAERNIQYPTSADVISITAAVTVHTQVTSARALVSTSAGGAFTSYALDGPGGTGDYTGSIGSFASGTYVRYYVEVTDNGGNTKVFPEGAPAQHNIFLVEDSTPIGSADVAFNEIQADPQSTDNGSSSEWVEIMNLRNTPINLSHFVFSPKAAIGSDIIVIPEGTIVPARGYLLIVGNKPLFESEYENSPFTFDPNLVIGAEGWENRSAITNGGNTVGLRHLNAWGYTGPAGDPIDVVVYDTAVIGTSNNGLTAELIKPGLPNNTNTNWSPSLIKGGTPGAPNSQYRPVLMSISRNLEFPGPSDAITFSVKAETADEAATVAAVSLNVATNGGEYTSYTLTYNSATDTWDSAPMGPYAAGTVLSFFSVGTDSFGDSSAYPIPYADHHFDMIIAQDGNHVELGQVVINEILYDNVGSDAYEFVELHNTTNAPIDLGYFRLVDNEYRPFVFPQGASIPADGYAIVTMDSFIFRTQYGNPPNATIYGWDGRFNLANGGDVVRLVHPNQYQMDDITTATEEVAYGTTSPWPNWATTETGPNVTGRSIELINPAMSDRSTNGSRWAWTTQVVTTEPMVQGTPGRQNSVYSPDSSVEDWSIY